MDEQGQEKCKIIQVAIPSPAHGLFDYRLKPGCNVAAGQRVQVPFGKRTMVAVIIAQATSTDVPEEKLRNALNLIDQKPVLPKEVLNLLLWASRYYHFPIGLVISNALPALLRKGKPARLQESEVYRVNEHVSSADSLTGAPVQQKILELLIERRGQSVGVDRLRLLSKNWGSSIQTLVKKGLVTCETVSDTPSNVASHQSLPLTDEQAHAVDTVTQNLEVFQPFLLQGVTGSGKTEVYLHCVNAVIKSGRQCLVIVPEISLTPQLMLRFEQRISGCLVSLHSALNDTERMQNWLCAANGIADVVIGTRSSVFTPLPRLGLIIIDEEHDVSLKQQEGFRYHARDLAMVRARNNQCRVLLGSATPSFETLHNVALKKIECLQLTQRAGGASAPRLSLLDIRRRPLTEGLSDRLLVQIQTHLSRGLQVLVFVNQRGYAPTLLCNDCGTPTQCQRCDAHLTVHLNAGKLRCHHCGAERPIPSVCYACGSERLERMGYGTQRIADALQASFPDYSLVRIDRDSTRRKGAMEAHLSKANSGEASILVGTQMLAKGHHFPKLSLVCVLDADRGLFSADFKALEHMAQMIIQVAGRAGREAVQGEVLIQTRNPDHPLLQTLISSGYDAFANEVLNERQEVQLPPYSFLALIRAESVQPFIAQRVLQSMAEKLNSFRNPDLLVLGPASAPMEKLAGRFRFQLMLQASKRSVLNNAIALLNDGIENLDDIRKCRWSIDMDPVNMS